MSRNRLAVLEGMDTLMPDSRSISGMPEISLDLLTNTLTLTTFLRSVAEIGITSDTLTMSVRSPIFFVKEKISLIYLDKSCQLHSKCKLYSPGLLAELMNKLAIVEFNCIVICHFFTSSCYTISTY